jgi:hypothetical protein
MSSPVNRQSPDSSNEVTSGAIRKRRQREREQLIKSTLQSQIQSFLAESPENAEIFWKRSGQKEQDALTRMGSKRTTSGFSQVSFPQLHSFTRHQILGGESRRSPPGDLGDLVEQTFPSSRFLNWSPTCPMWAA